MTTQLLSSGEFCKLRYDTIPVKIASANVSFISQQLKNVKFFIYDTLVANEQYAAHRSVYLYAFFTVLIIPYTTLYVDLRSESEFLVNFSNAQKCLCNDLLLPR